MDLLIKENADVSFGGGQCGCALQAALANATGRKDIIRLFLNNPASLNLQSRASDGSCLLHAAVLSGDHEILSELLNAGAKELISVKNNSGQTPFQLGVMYGNLDILEMLYSFSPDSDLILEEMDVDGRTPLHLAVENEAVEVIKWLLDRDARADIRDFGDCTPFQRAFQVKSFKILNLLFPKSAKGVQLLSASEWRSVQSGDVIMITSGGLETVETMSNEQLRQYVYDRSYSLTFLDSNIGEKEKSMAEDTPEKRIL